MPAHVVTLLVRGEAIPSHIKPTNLESLPAIVQAIASARNVSLKGV